MENKTLIKKEKSALGVWKHKLWEWKAKCLTYQWQNQKEGVLFDTGKETSIKMKYAEASMNSVFLKHKTLLC